MEITYVRFLLEGKMFAGVVWPDMHHPKNKKVEENGEERFEEPHPPGKAIVYYDESDKPRSVWYGHVEVIAIGLFLPALNPHEQESAEARVA